MLAELAVRLTLFLSGASACVVLLSRRSVRSWIAARRWRLLFFVLLSLGSACALADPYNAICGEANWIRYWTSGALVVAGGIAVANAMRKTHPRPDRLAGAAFACLLIAAGCDEIFQFHDRLAGSAGATGGILQPQDMVTLAVAVLGVVAVAAVFLVRYLGGWLGRQLREERYRVPLHLFAFAAFTFLLAMLLDSFGVHLRGAIADPARGGFWIAVTDVGRLANSTEELLEYLSALSLLMMVGTLFSVEALGCGTRPRDGTVPLAIR